MHLFRGPLPHFVARVVTDAAVISYTPRHNVKNSDALVVLYIPLKQHEAGKAKAI